MKKAFVCVVLALAASFLPAQAGKPAPAEASAPAKPEGKRLGRMGLIVNTPSLVSELDSYRAGVGLKLGGKSLDLRLGADVYVSNVGSLASLAISAYVENHLLRGIVSPYWGYGLETGLSSSGSTSQTDASTWNRDFIIPSTASATLGVEFFIWDFLSVFIEYELAFDLEADIQVSSLSGVKTSTVAWSYDLDSRLGNRGSIGFVIWFDRVVNVKKALASAIGG